MNRLKVFMITYGCDAEDVSEPKVAHKWVKEVSRDHDVTVLACSKYARYGCVKRQLPGCNVIEWVRPSIPASFNRFSSIVKPQYFLYQQKAKAFLREHFTKYHYDLVHHLNPFSYRYPSPAVGLNIPVVRGPISGGLETPNPLRKEIENNSPAFMKLRNLDKLRNRIDFLLKSNFRKISMVLMVAPYVKNCLPTLTFPNFKIINENGIDALPENHRRIVDPNVPVRLLYVGRIIRSKGLRDVIRAIGEARLGERIFLDIVGDGEDQRKCAEEAADLNINSHIKFHGWLPKNKVMEAYRKADIFIFPSFREPSGGVVLEAMSYGLPSILCDHGGPGYLARNGSAILLKIGHPLQMKQEMAAAIRKLVESPEQRARMGEIARKRVQDIFIWGKKRKIISQIYQETIALAQ